MNMRIIFPGLSLALVTVFLSTSFPSPGMGAQDSCHYKCLHDKQYNPGLSTNSTNLKTCEANCEAKRKALEERRKTLQQQIQQRRVPQSYM